MTVTHICHAGNDGNGDDTPLIPAWILFLAPPLPRDTAHKPLLKFPYPETRPLVPQWSHSVLVWGSPMML